MFFKRAMELISLAGRLTARWSPCRASQGQGGSRAGDRRIVRIKVNRGRHQGANRDRQGQGSPAQNGPLAVVNGALGKPKGKGKGKARARA